MSKNIAPWRTYLQKALHKNRSNLFSRYFALATVTKTGYPANRMVVFRGFLDNSNKLEIITDIRSQKIEDLSHNSYGEICWYFAKTREQFRITGKIEIITAHDDNQELLKERQKIWQKLSLAGKEQFYWENPRELSIENSEIPTVDIDEEKPIENFCLLLLNPEIVDHLELKGNPQNRHIYEMDNEEKWHMKKVNP
ncbi:Npun_F5749 family FMN-dependent PPOX-type flavoprotein [Geminocystis herdmanii]|uniref:Npun_F5749 family FMN-dependent PPOX-type flavoprotein n=1 Tax=Geminocystis herdmanii TaxID=669359 RepID=UPI00034C3117|nr:Npun_F5749 family FMN-dependent PPOX-type flavoprotein [Geminocystis herdmanii]